MIDNPHADRVRGLVSLTRRSSRIKQGLLLVEGPQAVLEALRFFPQDVRDVYVEDGRDSSLSDVLQCAATVTRWIHPVSNNVAKAVAPSAQGVFATVKLAAFPRLGIGATSSKGTGNTDRKNIDPAAPDRATSEIPGLDLSTHPGSFSMVLPRIQDPGNLGTLLRIADAFGAAQVVACKGTCDPTSPKVIRSSAGSFFHLPIVSGVDFSQVAAQAHVAGATVVGADIHKARPLHHYLETLRSASPPPHVLLVFGNEAQGFSEEERALLDERVAIPMCGRAESLNVASAASIMVYSVAQCLSSATDTPT